MSELSRSNTTRAAVATPAFARHSLVSSFNALLWTSLALALATAALST
jgi:hypothetical protein